METHDVVVVGAGLSGLRTATLLAEGGLDVRVLEARDRVGGRTKSGPMGRAVLDQGGQWVGPTQPRILALADALGVERFPTYCRGKKILDLGSVITTYRGSIPSLSIMNLIELHLLIRRIDKLARTVPRGAPQLARHAAELDAQSVAEWENAHIKRPGTRAMVDLLVTSILSEEPQNVSMLYLLHYIHCAGGVDPLATVQGGGQEQRFVLGAQTLSERMSDGLGDRVVLAAPVDAIVQDEGGVEVVSGERSWTSRRVVITAPPPVAARIRYDPLLPPERSAVAEGMSMGDTLKCVALYDRPFWREAGFSGESLSHTGTITFGFDNSSHDGAQAALVAFVTGQRAQELREEGEEAIRAAVVGDLVRYFGPEAEAISDLEIEDWSAEPWSAGGPVAVAPPGLLSTSGMGLYEPFGRLHWAGTETSDVWCGFMEGALCSAERVADEVFSALQEA
jgi:monoamine oxidase